LRGLDIFCGAGGSSTGARLAGIDVVAAIDMDPIATGTYKKNFPDAEVITNRLELVDPFSLRQSIGPIDVLLASPECTNHTCAKGAAPRSEESRATAMEVVRFATAFKPRWLVLENVVHMRPWSRYGELKKELVALGYHLSEQVLDASDFSVAQSRRRLFLVGDSVKTPALVGKRRIARKKTVKSILDPEGIWKMSTFYSDRRAQGTLDRAERAFKVLGKKSNFLLVYYGSDGSGGWQPLDRPLRTITTVDRFALLLHTRRGPEMRMLQVPELRRAMGFGETFQMPIGTRRDKIRLLGNGVCPPVMAAVLRALTASANTK
jgi:DNA (cytosine-5)-methyltransferase 1